MSIKIKLLISYLLLIVFSVSLLCFLVGSKSKDAVFKEVKDKSKSIADLIDTTVKVRNDLLSDKVLTDLTLADKLLINYGQIKVNYSQQLEANGTRLPIMYAGSERLTSSTKIVDDINKATGAVVSIFLIKDNKLVRISTTLLNGHKRIVGTYFDSDSPVTKSIMKNEPYYGTMVVNGKGYITGYKPLLDKNNKIVGALALGYEEMNDYLEKEIENIKIGDTGYVYVMNSEGDVIIHPSLKGQSLMKYDFTKKIIQSKEGEINYQFNGVEKIAEYKYYEKWDWYIVATANYDDLKSSSKSIIITTIVTGIIIFIISSIIALAITNKLVKPIDKLKNCMEIASEGDLSVHCDIKGNDEIGVLAKSFNHMVKENKKLLEQTMQYDKLKTEFIANISHELKTPLNIIFSTAQLFSLYLSKDVIEFDLVKLNKYTNTIKQNCYRLLRLVNNFIDITKIDSGFMELNLKNQNIVEVIENISLSTAEYIQSKSRTIIFDTDTEEKFMAFDEEKMERIILNLISNATKFTEPGDEIKINLYDKGTRVFIAVNDTGIGIPEDKLENIFERFKQVDPLLSRSHEGSGIGLSLVKSLVELHGGSVSVSSSYGEGTEFLIDLPAKIIHDDSDMNHIDDFKNHMNVEKIQIEFSDIYT